MFWCLSRVYSVRTKNYVGNFKTIIIHYVPSSPWLSSNLPWFLLNQRRFLLESVGSRHTGQRALDRGIHRFPFASRRETHATDRITLSSSRIELSVSPRAERVERMKEMGKWRLKSAPSKIKYVFGLTSLGCGSQQTKFYLTLKDEFLNKKYIFDFLGTSSFLQFFFDFS